MVTASKKEVIEIRPLDIKTIDVKIIGDTPLIMHCWSEKAKREMLEAQMKVAKGKAKEAKDPIADFINSMYWIEGMPEKKTENEFEKAIGKGAKFGFPITAFKQATISAAYRLKWVPDKMGLRGAMFFLPDATVAGIDLAEITSDPPVMREDMVKVGMGTADIRYRGEFDNWSAVLHIKYNASGQFSLQNIVNMVNAGGYICGVGEWRPERDGQFGMYHVAAE